LPTWKGATKEKTKKKKGKKKLGRANEILSVWRLARNRSQTMDYNNCTYYAGMRRAPETQVK